MILSSALDPRFRKLKFLTPEQVLNVQAKVQTQALGVRRDVDQQQLHDSVHDQLSCTSTVTTAAGPTTPVSSLDSLLNSETSSEENREGEAEDLNNQVRHRVLTYFAKEENPFHWWKANENRYPTLAKSYLCIADTSTPSERLFSAAGIIVSRKKAGLSPVHVDMLTFLHCNAKFLQSE